MDFTNRHIVVTGASTGIGRATAVLLARRGATVTLMARSRATLDEAVAEAGNGARAAIVDVSDKAALLAALDAAEAHAPIDGLFANAGTGGKFAPFTDYPDDVFDAVLRTNLMGPFWAMQRVLPGMIARGRGSIVVTGSLSSERGMAMNPAYVASKHAVLGLARAAALEVAPHGVRVNCLIPGFIDTPMMAEIPEAARQQLGGRIPQGRMGRPEETAELAAFLLSDAASHVTAQSWAADGGVLGTLSV